MRQGDMQKEKKCVLETVSWCFLYNCKEISLDRLAQTVMHESF